MSASTIFSLLNTFRTLPAKVLPAPHRLLLVVIADAADENGRAWPSIASRRRDSKPCRCLRISTYSSRKFTVAMQPVEKARPRCPHPS